VSSKARGPAPVWAIGTAAGWVAAVARVERAPVSWETWEAVAGGLVGRVMLSCCSNPQQA